MALTYRLISKTVEAVQYRSDNTLSSYPDWIIEALMKTADNVGNLRPANDGDQVGLLLRTTIIRSDGHARVQPTDWIICCDGHLTVMSDEAFKSTYEITPS